MEGMEESSIFDKIGEDYIIKRVVWENLLQTVKNDKSPGVPFMFDYSLNVSLKLQDPEGLKRAVEARISALLDQDFTDYWLEPEDFGDFMAMTTVGGPDSYLANLCRESVEKNLVDPIKAFIKPEFTNVNKPGRIIFSKSVVDALIVRLLIYNSMEHDKVKWFEQYSTIGMDMTDQDLMKQFYHNCFKSSSVVRNSDIRSFDWSFLEWCYWMYVSIMFKRAFGIFPWQTNGGARIPTCYRWWFKVFTASVVLDLRPVVICSSGELFQLTRSVMLSGAAWTAQGDTEVRAILPTIAYYYRFDPGDRERLNAQANGDDCVEDAVSPQDDMYADYKRLGFIITDCKDSKRGDPLYFCSQIITPNGSYPESWTKPVANLLNRSKVDSNIWDQFVTVYRRKPGSEEMFAFLLSILGRDLSQPRNNE